MCHPNDIKTKGLSTASFGEILMLCSWLKLVIKNNFDIHFLRRSFQLRGWEVTPWRLKKKLSVSKRYYNGRCEKKMNTKNI